MNLTSQDNRVDTAKSLHHRARLSRPLSHPLAFRPRLQAGELMVRLETLQLGELQVAPLSVT